MGRWRGIFQIPRDNIAATDLPVLLVGPVMVRRFFSKSQRGRLEYWVETTVFTADGRFHSCLGYRRGIHETGVWTAATAADADGRIWPDMPMDSGWGSRSRTLL